MDSLNEESMLSALLVELLKMSETARVDWGRYEDLLLAGWMLSLIVCTRESFAAFSGATRHFFRLINSPSPSTSVYSVTDGDWSAEANGGEGFKGSTWSVS